MQVPVYTPQVNPAPLPTARMDNPVTPTLAGGAAADQMARMGAGLEQAAGVLIDTQARIEKRQRADQILQREAAVSQDYLEFQAKARERRGEAAYGLALEGRQWWDDAMRRHTEDLDPDTAKQVRLQVDRQRVASLQSLGAYESQERRTSLVKSAGSAMQLAREAAAADPTNAALQADALEKIGVRTGIVAESEGLSAERVQELRGAEISQLHDGVARALVAQGKASAAAEYVKTNLPAITDTKVREQLQAYVRNASDAEVGDNEAGDVWKSMGPKDDKTPIELDKMEEALRERMKGNPTGLKAAVSSLRDRVQAHDKAQSERFTANTNGVFKLLDSGARMSQVMQSAEWNALPETQQRKITKTLDDEAYTREARAAARSQRAAADEGRELAALERRQRMLLYQNAGDYLRLQDPEVLGQMTRDQVMAKRTEFGLQGTQHLLDKWDGLQNKATALDAKIDNELFNNFARQVGLDPQKKGLSDSAKSERDAKLVDLRMAVEQQIAAEQAARKRALSYDEKQQLVQRIVADKVTVPGFWRNTDKPLVTLTPDEQAEAYVSVNDKRIRVASIPPAEREEIIRERRARRLPVNEFEIAKAWANKGNR